MVIISMKHNSDEHLEALKPIRTGLPLEPFQFQYALGMKFIQSPLRGAKLTSHVFLNNEAVFAVIAISI